MWFAINSGTPVSQQVTTTPSESSKPWVEVVNAKLVTLNDADGSVLKELKTGDEITAGVTLQTDALGQANIYFPDGSIARLDANTKLIIKDASFSGDTNKISVRLKLLAGKVWSKVFELATPDSTWEVSTPNSVATVRGTAFAVGYNNGKSSLMVSEHKVAMAVLDTTNDTKIPHLETLVNEGEQLDMNDLDIRVMKDKVTKLEAKSGIGANASGTVSGSDAIDLAMAEDFKGRVKTASDTWLKDAWVKHATEADSSMNKQIEDLKKKLPKIEDVRKEFKSILDEKKNVNENNSRNGTKETKESESTSTTKEQSGNNISRGNNMAATNPQKLTLSTKGNLSGIVEGDKVFFQALLSLSDGTTKNVTEDIDWKVIGPIGSINKGVFVAKLNSSVSEFGVGSGAVIASWKNEKTGGILFDKTPLFQVQTKVDTAPVDIGGQ